MTDASAALEDPRFSTGPDYFEALANHPEIFPYVSYAGQERIELASRWNECIGLEFEGGGWLFHWQSPGRFEVHTLFRRGTPLVAEKSALAAFAMFVYVGADELVTKVPRDLPKARALAEANGFRFQFTRAAAWPRAAGPVDLDFYRLTLDEWIVGNPSLIRIGKQFHEDLGEKVNHGEDEVHDAYAGFAVASGLAGHLSRGVEVYNRWATFAGYVPVHLEGDTVHFDGLAVTVNEEGISIKEDH